MGYERRFECIEGPLRSFSRDAVPGTTIAIVSTVHNPGVRLWEKHLQMERLFTGSKTSQTTDGERERSRLPLVHILIPGQALSHHSRPLTRSGHHCSHMGSISFRNRTCLNITQCSPPQVISSLVRNLDCDMAHIILSHSLRNNFEGIQPARAMGFGHRSWPLLTECASRDSEKI